MKELVDTLQSLQLRVWQLEKELEKFSPQREKGEEMKKADENTSAEGIEAREFWIPLTTLVVNSDKDRSPDDIHVIEAAPVLEKIKQLEAENASLKTCKQLLNEPVPEAIIHETIKRLESWGYHVSNRDQFKEMALEREITKLNEVIKVQREALECAPRYDEVLGERPSWRKAQEALQKADELMKGNVK